MGLILTDRILTEVDLARERIDERKMPLFVQQMHQGLINDVINHSSSVDDDNAKRSEEVIKNFQNAWNYSLKNFKTGIDLIFLQDLAGLVEPYTRAPGQTHSDIRNGAVKLEFGDFLYCPPSDRTRIQKELDEVSKILKEKNFHPLEEAIFTNFHLTRIQPFSNGNKRLSQIVMNTILYDQGFFPIVLREGVGGLYKDYLSGALKGFEENNATLENPEVDAYTNLDHRQRQFYDFMARKEVSELKTAEDYLKGLHSYTISLQARDKGSFYSAKKGLRSWFERRKLPYQERLRADKGEMELIGDIPEDVVKTILSDIRGLKFDIKGNGIR